MRAPHRTAEDWAQLLGTRVLSPDEFDGIAVSRDTRGWGLVETTQLSLAGPEQVDAFLADVKARGHVIAGVLRAQGDLPIRVVTREAARSQPSIKRHRREQDAASRR
jgi:hypothetical protein